MKHIMQLRLSFHLIIKSFIRVAYTAQKLCNIKTSSPIISVRGEVDIELVDSQPSISNPFPEYSHASLPILPKSI